MQNPVEHGDSCCGGRAGRQSPSSAPASVITGEVGTRRGAGVWPSLVFPEPQQHHALNWWFSHFFSFSPLLSRRTCIFLDRSSQGAQTDNVTSEPLAGRGPCPPPSRGPSVLIRQGTSPQVCQGWHTRGRWSLGPRPSLSAVGCIRPASLQRVQSARVPGS